MKQTAFFIAGLFWAASAMAQCTGYNCSSYGSAYAQNSYTTNPYATNPYASNPYATNPYAQGGTYGSGYGSDYGGRTLGGGNPSGSVGGLYPKEPTLGDSRQYRNTDPNKCRSLLCD